MKYPKSYTVKEWKRFDKITSDYIIIENEKYFLSMQEILIQKYDVTLTDYQTKKQKFQSIISKVNFENFNKGVETFNKGVKAFSSGTGSSPQKSRKTSKPVKIWSDKPEPRKSKRQSVQTRAEAWDNHEKNLEKLWGKKRKFKL